MGGLFKIFFGLPRSFNTLSETYLSLRVTQNIRVALITLLVCLFGLCVFVIAKLVIVYFIAWAIFFMILALVMLSCASGRQTLEKKMLMKL
jgi:hypothetical protein